MRQIDKAISIDLSTTLEKEAPSAHKIGAPCFTSLKIPKAPVKIFFPLPPVPTLALHEP